MKILSIETSCDETAISIIEVTGDKSAPSFSILSNIVYSQVELHKEFGGVFPTVAKREHAKNLPIIFTESLKNASILNTGGTTLYREKIKTLLEREQDLIEGMHTIAETIAKPEIDYIAVTTGPGLEPALWVGVNFARALNMIWDIPLVPVNHMEGHALSILLNANDSKIQNVQLSQFEFPALALLISGGHTELVVMNDWMNYKKIGATRDDAVGEAFDKVARLLGLPYPGGVAISKLAEEGEPREDIRLPRPMIDSPNYDFSFSGIKTAVLYLTQALGKIDEQTKKDISKEFEEAVTEVLVKKTLKAVEEFGVRTLIVAGGVSANTHIKNEIEKAISGLNMGIKTFFPTKDLSTDNSLMIAIAGYFGIISGKVSTDPQEIRANSNWSL